MHTLYNVTLIHQDIEHAVFRVSPYEVVTVSTSETNLLPGFNYDIHYTTDYELIFIRLSPKQI